MITIVEASFTGDFDVEESISRCQLAFLDAHCHDFDESGEEHKLDHTVLFKKYVSMIENKIEKAMKMKIPQFQMEEFLDKLKEREKEVREQ